MVGNDGYGSTKVRVTQTDYKSNYVCGKGRQQYRDNQEMRVEDVEAM